MLPLSKKLGPTALEIRDQLSKEFMVDYDEAGSIGKRYRRQDEIGTPYCITVDFDTVGDRDEGGRPLRHRPGPGHHGAGPSAHRSVEGVPAGKGGLLKSFQKVNLF